MTSSPIRIGSTVDPQLLDDIMLAIRRLIAEHGFTPSLAAIAVEAGVPAYPTANARNNRVSYALNLLEEAGRLTREGFGADRIIIIDGVIPAPRARADAEELHPGGALPGAITAYGSGRFRDDPRAVRDYHTAGKVSTPPTRTGGSVAGACADAGQSYRSIIVR